MGIFDGLFGRSNQGSGVSRLSLTKEEAVQKLQLRKDVFTLTLRKSGLEGLRARVAVVIDMSGSMRSLYANGSVQSAIERLLPIALRLDDNGELDIWLFSNGSKRLPSITEQDFYQYVDRVIMGRRENQIWGGTEYAPVMRDVVRKYVQEEPSALPSFVMFLTDGENSDRNSAEAVLREASQYGIFWQFIGIGNEEFSFLKRLDDMTGRVIDNADFFQINDLHDITDEELYGRLMTEYPGWEQKARQIGILR